MASEAVKVRLERLGQGVLSPQAGLEALSQILRGGLAATFSACQAVPSLICVNPFKWKKYLETVGMGQRVPEMYCQLHAEAGLVVPTTAAAVSRRSVSVVSMMEEEGREYAASIGLQSTESVHAVSRAFIQNEVEASLSEVLGSSTLEPDQPLMSGVVMQTGNQHTAYLHISSLMHIRPQSRTTTE
jgi:hypothetical protein